MGEKTYYTSATQITDMLEELAHAHDLEIETVNLQKRKKIKAYITRGVFLVLFVFLANMFFEVNAAKANGQVPTVLGHQIYEVQTGSMDPTLPVKSLIISKALTQKDTIEVGDIITFVNNNTTITHRVIEVIDNGTTIQYRTKGDNASNSIDPQLLTRENIKAKFVCKLPFYLSSSQSEGEAI